MKLLSIIIEMKRPAKKVKVNKSILGAIGAGVVGLFAGAAAVFLADKENRSKVKKTVDVVVKKGKTEAGIAKKKILSSKKKILKRI